MTTISTWMNGSLHEPTCKCLQTQLKGVEHCLITADHFCVREQDSIRLPTEWTFPRAMREVASPQTSFGVRLSRIHDECVTNEPQRTSAGRLWGRVSLGRILNHHALPLPLWPPSQPFLSRSSLNATTHKKSCVSEYFLPSSPHIPLKYCFSFQTKLNPCMKFKEKFEQV